MRVINGATYCLHYDPVGSLYLITGSSWLSVKEVEYDSFGDILRDSNSVFTIPFVCASGHCNYMPEIGKLTAWEPNIFAID
ncbi:hypothetical protein ACOHYD_11815 [Desulfobacterota bacterium M19]